MHYIFCHKNSIDATNPRTQFKRGIISYYKTNGITILKKHVNVDHGPIAKIFEEEEQFIERKRRKAITIFRTILKILSPNVLM
jgi:hypothetical protein